METALFVAIIAAAASLVSALLSGRSARSSRLSASQALRVNHQVAALDRDSDELRVAFHAVVDKVGAPQSSPEYVAAAVGALEALIACRAADKDLEECASQFQLNVANKGRTPGSANLKDVRRAYSSCQRGLEAKRELLLSAPSRPAFERSAIEPASERAKLGGTGTTSL